MHRGTETEDTEDNEDLVGDVAEGRGNEESECEVEKPGAKIRCWFPREGGEERKTYQFATAANDMPVALVSRDQTSAAYTQATGAKVSA